MLTLDNISQSARLEDALGRAKYEDIKSYIKLPGRAVQFSISVLANTTFVGEIDLHTYNNNINAVFIFVSLLIPMDKAVCSGLLTNYQMCNN